MLRLKARLAEAAPALYHLAFGDSVPPASAILTQDGRAGRYTPHGLEWVEIISQGATDAAFAVAKELAGGRETFTLRDEDGTTLSGFLPARGAGQLKLALAPDRRYGVSDFAATLPKALFAYLEALVRIGEPLWIVGDTGFEFDLGVALTPADHTLLARPPADRPPPYRASNLSPQSSLDDAMHAKDLGGFDTLVYAGELDGHTLEAIAHRGGVVLSQRATSVERALRRAGILQRQESAQQLLCLGAVVQLGRSASGGAIVTELAELRPAENSVSYTVFASRGIAEDPTALVALTRPNGLARIGAAGVAIDGDAMSDDALIDANQADDVVIDDADEDFDAAASDDSDDDTNDDTDDMSDDDASLDDSDDFDAVEGAAPDDASLDDFDDEGPGRGEGEELHEDPGWELDAARELVQAPGNEGKSGMFRARPVVRPSAPKKQPVVDDANADAEIGKLTLDAPRRRVIIPEAPSSSAQKRTFAEILKERHRFPPVSENGPTLTPPVLRNASGTFDEEDDEGDDRDQEEDITP